MNRFYRVAVGLALVTISLASACESTSLQHGKPIDTAYPDSEVVGAFLLTLSKPSPGKYVILAAETYAPAIEHEWITHQLQERPSRDANLVLGDLLASYEARNGTVHTVPANIESSSVRIVTPDVLGGLAVEALHGRERLSRMFPNAAAVVEVSQPGFSHDRSWAILVAFVTEGPFSGEQRVVIMHRIDDGWNVEWEEVAAAT